ncbi:MAG: DUF2281 domain-containing protein [Bacteroidia bacterium]|nr:DUF2281 domain-containing protein [Bacteroidia bacterium]
MSNLFLVPNDKLDEINNFIEYLLFKTKAVAEKKPLSIRGIWKGKGFENSDIETELAILRKEIQHSIDNKKI